MLDFAINQVTMPFAPLDEFLAVARKLGCTGVELRNDLDRPLFDGMSAKDVGTLVADHGLRLLGLSQIYPFNLWSDETADQTQKLIDMAVAARAETISLIPNKHGTPQDPQAEAEYLQRALKGTLPLLQSADMVALIEPLGFSSASLRLKAEAVQAVEALNAERWFGLVHDTFHHRLSGETAFYPDQTGIVHISGVDSTTLPLCDMQDAHRGLVGEPDRLNTLAQIAALTDSGYSGVFSFECFAPEVQQLVDPASALGLSIDFISSQLQQRAA